MPANPPRKSPNYWRIWKNEFGCNPPWYRPLIFMDLMLNTHRLLKIHHCEIEIIFAHSESIKYCHAHCLIEVWSE